MCQDIADTNDSIPKTKLINVKSIIEGLSGRERELVIAAAFSAAKPFGIDQAKFVILGGFQTTKTAKNTWSTIKKKLFAPAASSDLNGNITPPSTPKGEKSSRGSKASGQGKKRGSKALEDDDEGSPFDSPIKKRTKSTKNAETMDAIKAEERD